MPPTTTTDTRNLTTASTYRSVHSGGVGHHSSSSPDGTGGLDLRPRRDLLSRRFYSDVRRRLARILILAGSDCLSVFLALYVGSAAAVALGAPDPNWLSRFPVVAVLTLLGQAVMRTYGPVRESRRAERVIYGLLIALAGLAFIGFGDGHLQIGLPRSLYLGTFLAAALIGTRVCLALGMTVLYHRGRGVKNALIIGSEEDAWELIERFRAAREDDFRIVGHLAPDHSRDATAMGGIGDLSTVLEEQDIRNVIVSARLSPRGFRDLIAGCFAHGAAVSVVPATLTGIQAKVGSRNLLGWPILELEVPRLHLVQVLLKRIVDIFGAGVGILLLSPLIIGIPLLIKLDSRGPVLFRQRRLGLGGRPFTIYKFRSMRPDAEEVLRKDPELYRRYVQNNYKLPPEDDPRISRLGTFLRRTSLDEIPQLFNVLKGDMSLVGPRPIVPGEISQYGDEATTFLAVKPGVTGFWQVAGRSDIGYPERADLDLSYITRWSLLLDLKILALTIPSVLRRNGAH